MTEDLDKLIGMDFHEASAKGYDVRPLVIDGRSTMVTQDYVPTRINVNVVNSKIVKIVGLG